MKKALAILLVLCISVTNLVLPTYAAEENTSFVSNEESIEELDAALITPDMDRAISVAETYLYETALALYCYMDRPFAQHTIASIPKENENTLSTIVSKYTTVRENQKVIPYENAQIANGNLSAFYQNLELDRNRITYYGHLHEIQKITYRYFTPSYSVVSCNVDGDFAIVNLYETLDFHYSDAQLPSSIITHYYLTLLKFDGEWYIAAVESDDLFYQEFREDGFDLQKELAYVDNAYTNLDTSTVTASLTQSGKMTYTLNSTDRPYVGQNAAYYALTYSTKADDGQKIPSFKNENFKWTNESCQLFASQCVWAGLGGSNDQYSISNKLGMDATGTYEWWCTDQSYITNPYPWTSCSEFRTYINNVNASSTETGIICDTYTVPKNSNDMGSSVFSESDLLGAVLHVKGTDSALGHAVIVTEVNGMTRDKIYITYYNNCRKNVKLSSSYSASSDDKSKIFIIVPRYFRGDSISPTQYLSADLQNVLVRGSTAVSVNLKGYSSVQTAQLKMEIYAPGSATAIQTYIVSNATEVSGTYTFNIPGLWTIRISTSPFSGINDYYFIVRILGTPETTDE